MPRLVSADRPTGRFPRQVTVVRRKAQQGFAHHNRTVPNHEAFADALRAWADTQGVVQIDEADRPSVIDARWRLKRDHASVPTLRK